MWAYPTRSSSAKPAGAPDQVIVYAYGGRTAEMWFAQNSSQFERLTNLTVINLPVESTRAIAKLAQRNMQLQCTIQDGQLWLSDGKESVQVERVRLKEPSSRGY